MSMNIKNREAETMARALAAATGETLTSAVTIAVRERLERVELQQGSVAFARASRLREIAEDASKRWIEPLRSAEHGGLLYDDRGLPR